MALTWSWRQLIQQIRRHINNDFPGSDNKVSENEYLLYINQAMSFGIVGQVWNGAKVTGSLELPEAYLITFELPVLQQDDITRNWYSTLPQPPLSLPLGYSINRGYFADTINGQSTDWAWVKAKRVGRRMNMPLQYGIRAWVQNSRIWMASSDGGSLLGLTGYVEMPSTRANSLTDQINLPDDAQKVIFDMVVSRIKERLGLLQDIVQDNLPQGNKSS